MDGVLSRIRRWLRDPLLHFLVAGGVLFAAYAWLERAEPSPRVVRITAREVEWLAEAWSRQWQRSPDEQELRGLVTDFVREELLANEARELGLADDDTVVRRRLAQKMEFLVEDTARVADPGEEELRRVYEANRARFQEPARVSFRQVVFKDSARDTKDAARRAAEALERLSRPDSPADCAEIGDRSLVELEIAGEDETAVASLFGAAFAKEIFALETGEWRGPIASAFGLHLVRVSEKHPARVRELEEVRDEVEEEWRRQREQTEKEKYFAALLEKYDVVVDEDVATILGPLKLVLASEGAR